MVIKQINLLKIMLTAEVKLRLTFSSTVVPGVSMICIKISQSYPAISLQKKDENNDKNTPKYLTHMSMYNFQLLQSTNGSFIPWIIMSKLETYKKNHTYHATYNGSNTENRIDLTLKIAWDLSQILWELCCSVFSLICTMFRIFSH